MVWHYSVLQVVQGDKELRPAAAALLCDGELALYSASRKGRQMVASQLRLLVREAGLAVELTAAMEQTIGKGWADAGNCVRLRFQAMPAGLALISTGFVLIWLVGGAGCRYGCRCAAGPAWQLAPCRAAGTPALLAPWPTCAAGMPALPD